MLDALAHTRDRRLELSVIGTGRMEGELRAAAAARGLEGRLHWHGAVEEAWRYFPAFDVFALSSRTEGTPMVVLEAMAARVPVVATGVGGVPDLIGPAEGYVVAPEDPAALAAALERALSAEGAARATRAERRLATEFGVEPWLERHEAIYAAVLRRRAAA
jgi:glycosyltransferase involved in cell wall biosynthesis